MNDLFSAIDKMPWSEIGGWIGAVAAGLGSIAATGMSIISFWDKRKKQQQDDLHQKNLETEAIKSSNTMAAIEAQKEINDKQNKEIENLSALLKEHAQAMESLRTTLQIEVAKIEDQFKKTFYGAALVHRENKNIREKLEKFSTVHKKLSDYATMITSKKEGT